MIKGHSINFSDNRLKIFKNYYIAIDHLRNVKIIGSQCLKKDSFDLFNDPAGPHGHGFGLMFDGIDGAGHLIDRLTKTIKKGVQHIAGRPFDTEINNEIRCGEFAGQIFGQQCQIG